MKRLVIGLLFASAFVLASACTEDKCKNPARTTDAPKGVLVEGPAMKCNTVLTCPRNGGRPDNRFPLVGGDDPTIVDRGSASWNESRCRDKLWQLEWFDRKCTIEVSPEIICLDADGGSGQAGPAPTGGTLVTVGVGAGSGDSWYNGYETEGRGGGSNAEHGEGGHSGL